VDTVRSTPDQPANVLLTWNGTGGPNLSAVLGDVLGSPLNIAVYLEPQERGAVDHPRVRYRPPSPTERAQARYQVTLQGPPGADLPSLLDRVLNHLRRPDAGQVLLREPRLHAVTSRAQARADRGQRFFPDRDLLSDLFIRVGHDRAGWPGEASRTQEPAPPEARTRHRADDGAVGRLGFWRGST
jgi:hypothetical protein